MLATQQRAMSISSFTTDVSSLGVGSRTGPSLEGNLSLLLKIDLPQDCMCCRYNADGSHLAVGLIDGTIRVYDAFDGPALFTLSDEDTTKFHLPVTQIRFHVHAAGEKEEYSHILFASYASGHIKFWHYTSGSCLHTIFEDRETLTTALNYPIGQRFITAGADSHINLYDEKTKQIINVLEPSDSRDIMDGHRLKIFSLQYHPRHPNIFISAGWDDTVQYWDDRQKHSLRKISGPHICADSVDIDPLHDHILTGSWRKDNVLQIWDFGSGKKIKDVPQDPMNSSALYCAQWLGKDSIICGGTYHNMARIIDRGTLNTTGQLVDLPQSVYCIDNDKHGSSQRIAIGSGNTIYIVKGDKKDKGSSNQQQIL